MSQKVQYKRFSRDGFQPLTHKTSREMTNPHDVTIDIPMTRVATSNSATGARRPDLSPSHAERDADLPEEMDEKTGYQHQQRFHGGPGGIRRRYKEQGLENKTKDDGTLNAVGRLYKKIYNASVITRYFVYVAPLALAIAIPIIIGASVAPGARIGGVKIVWFFTWIEVLWVSLWVSKLVARFLPYLFQFFSGVVSSGTRKYALVLAALEIPVSLVGWAVASLTTFVPLMTLNPDQRARGETSLKPWESIIKNILFATLFSTLVFLGEKFLIQVLSISYHRKQFDDRIKESKRHVYLLTLLYQASRKMFPMYSREFLEEDYLISDILDLADASKRSSLLFKGHKRSGSATPMRLIQNVARVGDKVTSAFGNVAQEITGKKVFQPTAAHSVVVQALERKHSAEALAKRIWMSFVLEGKDALSIDDLVDVLGSEQEAEAHEAFEVLDVDSNGDISLEEMILRVTEFGRERQSIASSMHDVDQAINVLDNLLCTVVFVAVIFIFVAWLNKNFTTTLATAGTALLSMSFVFSVTAQEVLGSCIFLFVKHPFDVGDRVDVGDNQYVVERMSLLYTVFRRVKDQKRTQVPNIVLNSNWIDNVSRSKAMREQISIFVAFDTTFEDIDLLKKEMTNFVRDKDNARDFQPDIDVEVLDIADQSKMELRLEIRHKSNWANESIRAARRSKFMCALTLALRKIPLYGPGGGGPAAGDKANPTYSVAITDDIAKKNRDDFDENQDKGRLVPLKPHNRVQNGLEKTDSRKTDYLGMSTGVEAKEAAAMDHLIQRDIAVDPAEPLDQHRELILNKQRSEDVEEVKNLLKRESTTGRRRAARHSGLSREESTDIARLGTRTIPRIAEPSPQVPVDASQAERVSYFEDGNQAMTQPPVSQQGWTNVAPLNYTQTTSARPMSPQSYQPNAPMVSPAASSASPSRYVPGNAFSEQLHSPPQLQRVPVPGMPQMKRNLTHQQSAPQ
ncbi:hypothetical protein LTR47_000963 [Exophiala xenobiotica]|nr:hypothetical protein LTR47_000963 [Exophiala xenobiotica]KAK5244927.1 hypothetical protein LTS06_009559 [Exophiala xenobiotica]KAK5355622.1 hypothetical protein LTR61_001295 [Exophiala xenobiotica]KAK5385481.1 hypothetical protein LTR11_001854 [Exophiala xenobiotica]KAK5386587.1 hypothetical protein LTS03_001861 [Exophiala xenobiotica]